MNSGKVKI